MNEISTKSSSSLIAAVEHDKVVRPTKQSWYQKYSVGEQYESSSSVCNKAIGTLKPIEEVEVSALDAVAQGWLEEDVRPKLYDKITNTWTLCDSGSVVTCIPRQPGDVMDHSIKLRSVNGGSIPTFGSEEIVVRLGRKEYKIQAVKTDIPQRILGWDFFKKYRLNFEWGRFGDLFIVDKKADIRILLKYETFDPSHRISAVDCYEEPEFKELTPEMVYFQTQCMRNLGERTFAEGTFDGQVSAMTIDPEQSSPIAENLPLSPEVDPDYNKGYQENLDALSKLKEPFKSLVQKYDILRADFKKKPTTDIYHRIETAGPAFKSKVRPLLASSEKYEQGKKIWEEMESLGVIERVKQNTTLQYTSPLHMVKKPSGVGYRVCADFRLLNSITKADNYPLPLLRSFQSQIKGAKVFSKLDLTSAFHHLPIHPDDVHKTCVLSPWGGAFVYKRLAFGLTNGPASWQKYIDGVLSGIDNQFCYLDDILVASENVESHLSTLEKIFGRLQEHGLTLSLNKCTFAVPMVEYLGYQVSSTGICPQKKKVEAIQQIPAPRTQKLLLQFLGALNYFRSSLSGLVKNGKYHNAANLLQPLYSAATVPIAAQKFEEIWSNSPVLQASFEDAKKLLVQAAELAHPDPSLPLALMTDASQHSIGAVLMQRNRTGKWTPLGYMSRHLPIEKVNWSTCRKETLAAQAGLRYFITEIYGRHCTIFSDHAPLVLAFKNPQGFQLHDPVMQRALVEIGQFTRDVRHIAGLKNTGSDFLSRIPKALQGSAYKDEASLSSTVPPEPAVDDRRKCPTAEVMALEGRKLTAMNPLAIYEAQTACKEVELIESGRHPTSLIFKRIEMQGVEILCEVSQSQPRPFLPKALRKVVMQQMHYAHKGIKESIRLISTHYYWTDMKNEITRYVQTCHGCQSAKTSKTTPPHYGDFPVPDQRFSHCHIDIVGPLPESEGYRYLLTVIDRTTRQLSALPVKEPSAKACSQAFLLHYVALYGLPSACTSDQGSNFVSALFQEMQRNLGIEILHTPIYWPQGNGLIERSHRTLKESIKAQLVEMGQKYKSDWYNVLPWALLGQRTAFNRDLGTSSNELTLGTHVQVPGCILKEVSSNSEEPNIEQILEKLQIKDGRVAIPTSKIVQKEIDPPPDTVTHVYARQHDTRGLEAPYKGPFKVLSRPTRSTLEIKTGLTKGGEVRSEVRAWADCKPAHRRDETIEASRPARGRPPKNPGLESDARVVTDNQNISDQSSNVNKVGTAEESLPQLNSNVGGKPPARSTRNPAPNYVDAVIASIDFSKPPPNMWSASKSELIDINKSIGSNDVWRVLSSGLKS